MRARRIIAALAGLVIGLSALAFYQLRLLREARDQLTRAIQTSPDLPQTGTQRPVRLRLHDLPPIAIRTQFQSLDWGSIETNDYAAYVANLRKVGCPEETIRDIITADLDKLFAARRRALPRPPTEPRFWLHPDEDPDRGPGSDFEREHEGALLALERERRSLAVALLGEGALQAEFTERVAEVMADPELEFLQPENRRAVAEAQARLRQELDALDALDDPNVRRERQQAAEQAYDLALASALTPDDREQLEMRTSRLGDGLRERLRGFGAQEEFVALYRLERDFARQQEELEHAANTLGAAPGGDPQWAERLEAAQIQLDQAVQKTLGPDRYADYQRTLDPDYQTLFSLAREHEMPTTVAREVYDMRRTVAQHVDAVRSSPLLSLDQKRAALAAIQSETHNAIVEVLGEPLLREYEQQGGSWLELLTSTDGLQETLPLALPQDDAALALPPDNATLLPAPILPVP